MIIANQKFSHIVEVILIFQIMGLNSDLFFYYNSNIDAKNIVCDYIDTKQLNKLKSEKFSIVNQFINYSQKSKFKKKKFYFKKK